MLITKKQIKEISELIIEGFQSSIKDNADNIPMVAEVNYLTKCVKNALACNLEKSTKEFSVAEIIGSSIIFKSLGANKIDSGEFTEAVEIFTFVYNLTGGQLYKELSDAYVGLSQQQGESDALEAIKSLTKALEINPENDKASQLLFITYTKNGAKSCKEEKYKEAMVSYKKALMFAPKQVDDKENLSMLYSNIGYIQFKEENFKKAIKSFTKALELDPENEIAKDNLSACRPEIEVVGNAGFVTHAKAEIISSSKEQTEHKAKAALPKPSPKSAEPTPSESAAERIPVSSISVTVLPDGSYEEAEALETALRLEPENDEIKKNLAFVYVKIAVEKFVLGDIVESMEKLTKALELDPDSDKANEMFSIVCLESAKTTSVEPVVLASASSTSSEDSSAIVLAEKSLLSQVLKAARGVERKLCNHSLITKSLLCTR